MYKAIITILFTFSIFSCGNNVKNIACTDNNWTEIGYEVALSGKSVREFERYKEQCGTLGNAEKDLYLAGYTKGIAEFCTYDSGYQLGLRNAELLNICPYEIRTKFVQGYDVGSREYKIIMVNMEREEAAASQFAEQAEREAQRAAAAEAQQQMMQQRN